MSQAPATETALTPASVAAGLTNLSAVQLGSMTQAERDQLLALVSSIPGLYKHDGSDKGDAAAALSALSQQQQQQAQQHFQNLMPGQLPAGFPGVVGVNDPGPSSHPRGPPNLGQLSVAAMQQANPGQQGLPHAPHEQQGGSDDGDDGQDTQPQSSGGRRGGRGGAAMGSDEWTRQRKDNHKEVERRRRGNINEGINELGRIVPNGSGEKAKGAILSRAVQYIHHLKENEARNIEKWTLEKLLMDQAMGDLQAQLEEVKRMWEEERSTRTRAEAELDALRRGAGGSNKRASEDDGKDEDGKRQRTE